MLFRIVALLVFVVWLGVNVTGSAGDDFDQYSGPSIIVANSQATGDEDLKLFNFAFLAPLFCLDSLLLAVNLHIAKVFALFKDATKQFELNCSFLL